MFNNKNELIKQVNWALRAREPIGFRAVSEVSAKWKPEGYEVRFDGGKAVIAHFEGRIVGIAWQQMGDVERHLLAKNCDELPHRAIVAKETIESRVTVVASICIFYLKGCGAARCDFMGRFGGKSDF